MTAIAESPGTVEEDGRADLQRRIGNGKDPPIADIPASERQSDTAFPAL